MITSALSPRDSSKPLLLLLSLLFLCAGCGRQPKPLIVDMHKLKLSDFAVNGVRFDSSLDAIKKRFGPPAPDRPDPMGWEDLRYRNFSASAQNRVIQILSGDKLRVGAHDVPADINVFDFCDAYGLTDEPREQARSRYPTINFYLPACDVTLHVDRQRVYAYTLSLHSPFAE